MVYLFCFFPTIWQLRQGKISPSRVMRRYEEELLSLRKAGPPLRFEPLQRSPGPQVERIFIRAEDSRFFDHWGLDFEALEAAFRYNLRKNRLAIGASTITQQTAKNLFLSFERTLLRKWHEVILSLMLELSLSKAQILFIYLNIAEFAEGVYGVGAAAKFYFQKPVGSLVEDEWVQLAATLPSPRKDNPAKRTPHFERRYARIKALSGLTEGLRY